jgi:competence protein ComGC
MVYLKRSACWARGGYSLIELMVMVVILGLLMGVLMPALSRARMTAQMQNNQNNVRRLNAAYTQYALDFKNSLLPGYPSNGSQMLGGAGVVEGTRVTPGSASSAWNCVWGGEVVSVSAPMAARYPVRLSAYVEDMSSLVQGHRSEKFSAGNSVSSTTALDYATQHPTWGLNSLYVGGHGVTGSGTFGDAALWGGGYSQLTGRAVQGGPAVLKMDEVRRPAGLITFLDTKRRDQPMNLAGTGPGAGTMPGYQGAYREGSFVCYPPRFSSFAGGKAAVNFKLWKEGTGETYYSAQPDVDADISASMPSPWWGTGVVTSYIDGHANVMTIGQLNDMRLWSNKAEGKSDAVRDDGDPNV